MLQLEISTIINLTGDLAPRNRSFALGTFQVISFLLGWSIILITANHNEIYGCNKSINVKIANTTKKWVKFSWLKNFFQCELVGNSYATTWGKMEWMLLSIRMPPTYITFQMEKMYKAMLNYILCLNFITSIMFKLKVLQIFEIAHLLRPSFSSPLWRSSSSSFDGCSTYSHISQ